MRKISDSLLKVIKDPTISDSAVRVYIYLCVYCPKGAISQKEMMEDLGQGRTRLTSALKELEEKNLLIRRQKIHAGRFGHYEYLTIEHKT